MPKQTSQMKCGAFEKWMWIELIGFDNELKDFGVDAFVEKAGFAPKVLALLIADPAFIHDHNGMSRPRKLSPGECSYGAHPFNDERNRQQWTNLQVRGLVRELQRHGVKVHFSVFDHPDQQWMERHPNALYVRKTGERIGSICPWKRLATYVPQTAKKNKNSSTSHKADRPLDDRTTGVAGHGLPVGLRGSSALLLCLRQSI